jgi:hypothetical protein
MIETIQSTAHPDHRQCLDRLVAETDFETAFSALDHAHRHLPSDEFLPILARARHAHGPPIEFLPDVFREMRRAETIRSRSAP